MFLPIFCITFILTSSVCLPSLSLTLGIAHFFHIALGYPKFLSTTPQRWSFPVSTLLNISFFRFTPVLTYSSSIPLCDPERGLTLSPSGRKSGLAGLGWVSLPPKLLDAPARPSFTATSRYHRGTHSSRRLFSGHAPQTRCSDYSSFSFAS